MKVTVTPTVVGAIRIVSKGLEKEIGGTGDQRKNCDHPDHKLLRSEYLEEFWRSKETCCHSNFSEKPPIKTVVK